MDQHARTSGSVPATILVVDDDDAMLLLCARRLEQAGYRVIQCTGSPEALQWLAEHSDPVDLVLSDLLLPPPGLQLAKAGGQFPRVHGHQFIQEAARLKKKTSG